MGKILKTRFTTGFEALIAGVIVVGLSVGVYFAAPGLRVGLSKQVNGLSLSTDNVNNVTKGAMLPVPNTNVSTKSASKGMIRIAEYAWNANAGMIVANGGPRTTEGSLMENAGLNMEIVRLDGCDDLRNMMVKFTDEFSNGAQYPKSDKSAPMVSIMGDGAVFFITTTQNALDEKFGKGKFHVQNIGAIGMSYGEDKVIGPKKWKDDPQSMRGSVISSVVGDGDWILAVNFCGANNIPVNPDPTTYDPDAVNFVPSQDADFINSAKELVKSQKTGYSVPLKEVKNGKLTGKTVNHLIDGCTTWTPGDTIAFGALSGFTDIVSTKDFVNQMPATVIVIKEWALQHEKEVIAMLKATYVANNQIKLYDQWAHAAADATAKTYNAFDGNYWYNMFKGKANVDNTGLTYHIGGSKVLNYADVMQYFGITDGNNRYKAVYDQISTYLVQLNPCDFNKTCKSGVESYDDAVNLYFLKSVTIDDAGKVEKVDYAQTKTDVLAKGQWHINFATGSDAIEGSTKDLDKIYNLLVNAEDTKLNIVGHTDNTGNSTSNVDLSKRRAESVVNYLTQKGIPADRFQTVDGKGDTQPVADNKTPIGKAKNRRVEITLLN